MTVAAEKPRRKYEVAWNTLKSKKMLVLRVTPAFVAQVKKGMIKEKDQDTVFKLLNEHDQLYLEIKYEEVRQELTFKLKQRFGLEGIKL